MNCNNTPPHQSLHAHRSFTGWARENINVTNFSLTDYVPHIQNYKLLLSSTAVKCCFKTLYSSERPKK